MGTVLEPTPPLLSFELRFIWKMGRGHLPCLQYRTTPSLFWLLTARARRRGLGAVARPFPFRSPSYVYSSLANSQRDSMPPSVLVLVQFFSFPNSHAGLDSSRRPIRDAPFFHGYEDSLHAFSLVLFPFFSGCRLITTRPRFCALFLPSTVGFRFFRAGREVGPTFIDIFLERMIPYEAILFASWGLMAAFFDFGHCDAFF